jgi:hypothetical protein
LKKALTIGLVAAALAATLPFVFAGARTEARPEAEQTAAYTIAARVRIADASDAVPAYTRGPRIIHVPQAGERARASVSERDDPYVSDSDIDDEEVAPPPRRRLAPPPVRSTPRWAPRREAAPSPKPIRRVDLPKFRDEPIPQPPGPRRAVLSAPPPWAEGPTPIRPTPKFETKFGASVVTESTPPRGYTPPLAVPIAEQPDDVSK